MPTSFARTRTLGALASTALASTALASTILAALLTGCGMGTFNHAASVEAPIAAATGGAIQGTAFGGQQPVVGATLQLYAANLASYGGRATPLLPTSSPIKTDAGGGFTITGQYTCPAPDAPVYLVATGGNPGLSANNPNLAEMAALGSCNTLKANAAKTFIQMNELTTVGAIYALAPFMAGIANLGSSAANTTGLALAFADVNVLVNNSTGTVGGTALPTGATLPTAEMNTLADILTACVNSTGGHSGDGTPCGNLFAAATPPGGAAPTDTVTAALNIVQHPGQGVAALYNSVVPSPPFQPTLSAAPNDWTLAVTYAAGGLASPSAVAIDAGDNVWITNRAGNTATELAHSGAVLATSTATLNGPSAVAIDANGAPWIGNGLNNTLTHLTTAGTVSATATGGGLNAPAGVAIDPQGNLWVANGGANAVSEFTSAGAAVSPSTGYAPTGIVRPLGIAISAH